MKNTRRGGGRGATVPANHATYQGESFMSSFELVAIIGLRIFPGRAQVKAVFGETRFKGGRIKTQDCSFPVAGSEYIWFGGGHGQRPVLQSRTGARLEGGGWWVAGLGSFRWRSLKSVPRREIQLRSRWRQQRTLLGGVVGWAGWTGFFFFFVFGGRTGRASRDLHPHWQVMLVML